MKAQDPVVQTPAERRAAETKLAELVERFAPDHARLVMGLRRALRKRMPRAHEVVYEYRDCVVISVSPSQHGYEGVFAIRAEDQGVKLYFNSGASLADPQKLLKGSGTQVRWIGVQATSDLTKPAIAELMDAALAHSRVAFTHDAKGSIVIRETTASAKAKPARKKASKATGVPRRTSAKKAKTPKKSG